MLDRVTITNFRCFAHVNVRLRPFTVLIGQNDTGKSSFLSAIRQLTEGRLSPADMRRGAQSALVRVKWCGQDVTFESVAPKAASW